MTTETHTTVQLISVLNDPSKKIALPTTYRDAILVEYGVEVSQLIGEFPIHAVFVREGLGLGIFHDDKGKERFVLHGIDLRPGEDKNIQEVGSEIYSIWKSFPKKKLLTWHQLQQNWGKLFQKAAQAS